MKKSISKMAILMLVIIASLMSLIGCEKTSNQPVVTNSPAKKENINFTETLKVYNASEYIDLTTIEDFEREFSIKIEYKEFESNEDMYNEVSKNPSNYDILVPSDYIIDRLIKEDSLAKLDKSKVTNIKNIAEEYLNPVYDADNEYVVPYMVGTLGVLYNKKKVATPIESWSTLYDSQYRGKVYMLNSQRDAIGIALKSLGYSMNSSDDGELEQAKAKLKAIRDNAAAYKESEEIRDKLVAGEGIIGVVYSGDAKTAIDRNPNLAYAIPEEGANKWVDGFVIMKNTQHLEAAYKFINFMCRPSIAVRNMTKIGYTSPIKGAWSEFNGNTVMFPMEEELNRCEAFTYDAQATSKYTKLWSDVR